MTIALLYGGRSPEHEVSLSSASGVLRALTARHDTTVEVIAITRDGHWFHQSFEHQNARAQANTALDIQTGDERGVVVIPGEGFARRGGAPIPVDCVLPILHGSYGEDGTLQGLLEMARLPYVGSGVVGSSVGMDKMRTKQLWMDQGLPVVPYLAVRKDDVADDAGVQRLHDTIVDRLGFPIFVKPNAAGSSIGITRVASAADLPAALKRAFAVDGQVLIEQALPVREVETAVLGNESPVAFPPGEVIPSHEFYDYDAKYEDPDGARLVIPADLPEAVRQDVMDLAVAAFRAIDGAGFARVDCFVVDSANGLQIYLNEINTIPGFTPISMYPKMVEAGGIPYGDLLVRLVTLARERFAERESRAYDAR